MNVSPPITGNQTPGLIGGAGRYPAVPPTDSSAKEDRGAGASPSNPNPASRFLSALITPETWREAFTQSIATIRQNFHGQLQTA